MVLKHWILLLMLSDVPHWTFETHSPYTLGNSEERMYFCCRSWQAFKGIFCGIIRLLQRVLIHVSGEEVGKAACVEHKIYSWERSMSRKGSRRWEQLGILLASIFPICVLGTIIKLDILGGCYLGNTMLGFKKREWPWLLFVFQDRFSLSRYSSG